MNSEKLNNNQINNLILPITLQLEVTNKCNMHCGFCYNNSTVERENDLSKDEWISFSHSVVSCGGVFQCIISGGEPTLFKNNIIDIMDIYSYDGSAFTLISNGTGIDKEFAFLLSKYKWYWVQVSIDSHLPQKHDYIRGCIGAWEQAITAIKYLKKYGIPVSIASVITKDNINEMEDIIKLAFSLGVDQVIFSSVLYSGRASENKNYFSLEEEFKSKYHILIEQYKNTILIARAATYSEQIENILSHLPTSLIVRPDGNVKLDCILPFVIGNIRDNSIIEIWKRAKLIYKEKFFKDYLKKALNNKFAVIANNTNNDILY